MDTVRVYRTAETFGGPSRRAGPSIWATRPKHGGELRIASARGIHLDRIRGIRSTTTRFEQISWIGLVSASDDLGRPGRCPVTAPSEPVDHGTWISSPVDTGRSPRSPPTEAECRDPP